MPRERIEGVTVPINVKIENDKDMGNVVCRVGRATFTAELKDLHEASPDGAFKDKLTAILYPAPPPAPPVGG